MAKKELAKAQDNIENFLENSNNSIFKLKDLRRVLKNNRHGWELGYSLTERDFVDFLIKSTKMKKSLSSFLNEWKSVIRGENHPHIK